MQSRKAAKGLQRPPKARYHGKCGPRRRKCPAACSIQIPSVVLEMSLSDTIQSDLVAAMRSKETLRLGTLRMMKTAIKHKEIEKREALSDGEIHSVLQTLVKQRRDSAEQFRKGDREAMAVNEESEIGFIEVYLPAPATEAEILSAIAAAIDETAAQGPRDMGKVMKATKDRLTGKTVDGKLVSMRVKEALQSE